MIYEVDSTDIAVTVGKTSEIDVGQMVTYIKSGKKEIDAAVAEKMVEISVAATNANVWAEGTDAQVVALGGTHSAKGWATQEANNYGVTATGSITARTLADRFSDVINVKDFGATGDGVTDDTTSLQSAINYAIANQKTLFVPSGTYVCSSLQAKPNLGHNNNTILKMQGSYKTIISLSGSFTIAGRLACDFADMTIQSTNTSDATLIFGDYDYYCNRCTFRNIRVRGNPTAVNFVYAFDMGWWDCRFSSQPTYAENVNEQPVVIFAQAQNTEPAATDQMVFARCQFEGTAGNGTFIYMDSTYKTYATTFLGCHFETRNLNSRVFHIKKGSQITFLGCEFTNNSYNASSSITDTHTKAINIIEENSDVTFISCLWDRWNNKLIQLDPDTENFNFYGKTTVNFSQSSDLKISDFFEGVTSPKSRWQIRILQPNGSWYSNESQITRARELQLLDSSENLQGIINYFSGLGIVMRLGNDYTTYQKAGVFGPYTSNNDNLGSSNHLWKEIFAASSTINTSDERQKQDITTIDERVFRAWEKVGFKQFLFKDAVEKKGENARIHFGLIAQQVKEAFESEGLDGFKYGLLCYDEWDDEYTDIEVVDKEAEYNEETEEFIPAVTHTEHRLVCAAGNSYGIRYSEALALECAYQRWKLEKLSQQLEERV